MVKGDCGGITPYFPKWFRLQLDILAPNSGRWSLVGWQPYKTAAPAIFKRLRATLKLLINMETLKVRVRANCLKVTQWQSTGYRDRVWISVFPSDGTRPPAGTKRTSINSLSCGGGVRPSEVFFSTTFFLKLILVAVDANPVMRPVLNPLCTKKEMFLLQKRRIFCHTAILFWCHEWQGCLLLPVMSCTTEPLKLWVYLLYLMLRKEMIAVTHHRVQSKHEALFPDQKWF